MQRDVLLCLPIDGHSQNQVNHQTLRSAHGGNVGLLFLGVTVNVGCVSWKVIGPARSSPLEEQMTPAPSTTVLASLAQNGKHGSASAI